MTAGEILRAAGLDADLARVLFHPIEPDEVSVRGAPGWLMRLWGRGIQAITVRETVYVDPGFLTGPERRLGLLLVHELAHARQWRDLGVIGFLIRYMAGYLRGRIRHLGHRQAYMSIGLEVEARDLATRFR